MALTKKDEFLEAAFDLGQWIETHWKTVVRGAVVFLVLAVLVAVAFGWKQHRVSRAIAALEAGTNAFNRAASAQYGDVDALADALVHFEEAEAKAGRNAPGPLAKYYRGVTLIRLGRTDEALEVLENFVEQSSGDDPLDWAGRALLAQIYADEGNTERAIVLLEAVTGADSSYPVEQALLQLGNVQAKAGDQAAARKNWQKVVDMFPNSSGASQARELLDG